MPELSNTCVVNVTYVQPKKEEKKPRKKVKKIEIEKILLGLIPVFATIGIAAYKLTRKS